MWMDLHVNHTRNVQITTSKNPCKKITRTPFAQPWILQSRTHAMIMATYVENYFFHIGSGKFWNLVCWTRARRSSDERTEDVL